MDDLSTRLAEMKKDHRGRGEEKKERGEKTPYQTLLDSIKDGTYTIEELTAARDAKIIDPNEYELLLFLIMEKRRLLT